MITANKIQQKVFSKNYKDAKEEDKLRGGKKTSRSDIDFAVQMELAWDLTTILRASDDKLILEIKKLKEKYSK